jgi:microcystin-dependent protein
MPRTQLTVPTTFGPQTSPIALNKLDGDFNAIIAAWDDATQWQNAVGDTGAINAYVASFGAGITVSLVEGLQVQIKVNNTNSGASTLNLNATGAKPIVRPDGTALSSGDIVAGGYFHLVYTVGAASWQLISPWMTIPSLGTNPGITGEIRGFAGTVQPTAWLWCNGQAVSRGTFAALFAVIGTTFGPGDGATTFNVPDLRGRTIYGVDNMGGAAAANRITNAVCNIVGTTLGAAGGDQNIPTHLHVNTLTDLGHTHGGIPGNNVGGAGTGGGGADCAVATYIGSQNSGGNNSAPMSITNVNAGTGTGANVSPGMMCNWIIRT